MRHQLVRHATAWAAGLGIAVTVMLAALAPAGAAPADPTIPGLRAQAADLRGQLAALQANQSQAAQQAIAAEAELTATQAKIVAQQTELDGINHELAQTNAALTATTARWNADRHSLAEIIVGQYKLNNSSFPLQSVIDAGSVNALIDSMAALQHTGAQVAVLTDRVNGEKQRLDDLQASEEAQQKQAETAMAQLNDLAAQRTAEAQTFSDRAASLSGRAAALMQQITAVTGQIWQMEQAQLATSSANQGAARITGNALPPFGLGPRYDAFPWGQCTWYVASLRDVTWNGDAAAWAGAAAAKGVPEGQIPKSGAIVVWGRGNGYSEFGHVGYVVSVQGPTKFTVNEANYLGVGVVDERAVPSLNDVAAFIY